MGPQKILFVDFDRTLFDCERFLQHFWVAAGDLFSIDTTFATHEYPKFYYTARPGITTYSLENHIKSYTSLPAEMVMQRVWAALQGKNFMYDDAQAIFSLAAGDTQVIILTCGEVEFQQYKLSLCPALQYLPVQIILEPKRDYIARNHAGDTGWLIDDKPNQRLPLGFTEIYLNREDTMPRRVNGKVYTVNGLGAATEVVLSQIQSVFSPELWKIPASGVKP